MTTPADNSPAPTTNVPPQTTAEMFEQVGRALGTDAQEVASMLEAIDRGESRADYFGFTDEVLRSIEAIALAYYRGQRYQDAHVVFEMIATLTDGTWGAAWRGLGACAQAQKDFPHAIDAFRRALAQNKDDAHSAVYLGECLCLSGNTQEGLEVLHAVLQRAGEAGGAGSATPERPKITVAQQGKIRASKDQDAPHLLRAQAIVRAKGVAQVPPTPPPKAQPAAAAKAGLPPSPTPSLEDTLDSAAENALEKVLQGLTVQQPVANPEIQALLDDPTTRAQLNELASAVRSGAMTIRQVADFSAEQMDAGYAIACQMLERGEPLKAMQLAGWMLFIDSRDTRFYRLAGLCMHHLKYYPLADYYYTLVGIWRQGGSDAATLIYQGEIKLLLGERTEGLGLLQQGTALGAQDATLRDVVKRGRALLKQVEHPSP